MKKHFAVAAVLLSSACGGFQVPEPDLAANVAASLPPAEPAVITLPISISLGKIRSTLSSQFPVSDSLTQAQCVALGGAICHQYVYRRDSIELRMNGDRIELSNRLRYRGRVALPAVGGVVSCGYAPEEMKRAELQAGTALYWRSDWRLASRGTAITVNLPDRCEVTALRINATPLMKGIVDGQAEKLRQQLDSAIPALADLRPVADSLWRTMLRPFPLDSASTTWLSLAPDAVLLARPLGRGDALTTAVVITARPHATLGAKPATERRPLPVLGLATTQNGIHIPVDIALPYADLSARVTQLMKGEIPNQNLFIDDVRIRGTGDTMLVTVAVHGSVKGDFVALGRVRYDSSARHLQVSDLQWTLASASKLDRLKTSIGAFRINRALDQATGHGQLDVGVQLDSLRRQLTSQLNRPLAPGVTVSGAVSDIRIAAIAATSTSFVLRVVLDGAAKLEVR